MDFHVAVGFALVVEQAERIGANAGDAAVIDLYRRWIAAQAPAHPQLHAAWFNLGVELGLAGDSAGAAAAYQAALRLQPGFAQAAINLGLLLERAGNNSGAMASWMAATQDDASRTSLLNHQARLLERTGRLPAALATLQASLRTDPNQPDVIQHWIHVRQKLCAWPVLDGAALGLDRAALIGHCGPLAGLALFDDVGVQTAIGAAWIARKTVPGGAVLSPRGGYAHERIRVGYLSSDYCRHAMSFLIAELFERHDRGRFEIYGYCSSIDDASAIRRRVLAAFDHVRIVRELSDEAAARLIARDEIDILIDLNGLTQGARLGVLRWRPAPVQATYLGFVGPVPLPELDFLFCDDVVVPPGSAHAYAPKPLSIGTNYQANDRKREIGAPVSRAAAGLPAEGFVFCCFSNHYKITQDMFACWMAVLQAVTGAWLWLIADNEWSCANLRAAAASAGVDPARLIFAGRVDPGSYMARLAAADLFLDTFPYNAGTIASDAIRMGLPLLTLAGHSFASRMAARLLLAVGAEAGVVFDQDAYVRMAVRLASENEIYLAYKAHFTMENWERGVGDIEGLTQSLETILEKVAT